MLHKPPKADTILIIIAFLICFGINVVRIINVPVTHDEVLTYEIITSSSWKEIIINDYPNANNHVLNSLLAKLSINTFGDTLFALRVSALLAQLIYVVFSLLLAKQLFKDRLFIIVCFLLLQLNPFLFEFWGLCRGYGLSVAFMMGSVYYFFRYTGTDKIMNLIVSLLLMVAGVYANMCILNYSVGLAGAVAVHVFLSCGRYKALKTGAIVLASAILLYIMIGDHIKMLKAKNEFLYGGENFLYDTIGGLIQYTFYLDNINLAVRIAAIVLVLMVILVGLFWLSSMRNNKSGIANNGVLLWVLLVIPALSTIVQYYLLDTKFLIDRKALLFVPLVTINILFALQGIKKALPRRLVVMAILLLFTGNFIRNINFSSTTLWDYDSHTPWLLKRMIDNKIEKGEVKVYLDWYFSPSFRYYVDRSYKNEFGHIEKYMEIAYGKTEYDYYLIREWEIQKVPEIYILDTVFNKGQFFLYKRKSGSITSASDE